MRKHASAWAIKINNKKKNNNNTLPILDNVHNLSVSFNLKRKIGTLNFKCSSCVKKEFRVLACENTRVYNHPREKSRIGQYLKHVVVLRCKRLIIFFD